ncbi:MAG: ribosome small subunit-dependent GTPase A [Duncaniella sp.]|uniref:ribosome small subunit-dependent GTPase A n=1 Tax=Duncaniella sp. TaxID=2518496 RepID=UPI0023C5FA7A|nr:ribosome small subunit-dependent GTPase A [Duncaniella sp.]MDE6089655.1 ribosome small subunit-dependent GTPase A [Duncaniella sp.]
MTGTVIKNTGSSYTVRTDEGATVNCKIKGNFRLKGIRTTNPVAVGDRVTITGDKEENNYITAIEPRRNYIIRKATNLSKQGHILAANLDQVCLVVTLFHPITSTTFIDRFLATAEAYRVPAILVINKIDLLEGDEEALEYLDGVCYLYESIGYQVVKLSAKTGEGIETLYEKLKGKTTLFSGNSGVGKSTLINDLIPGLQLATAEISDTHDTGMHTTTFSEMFQIPDLDPESFIIDTPGVKGFGTLEFDKHEVSHFFPEIFKVGAECRYGDCTHTHEPGCAVREALENHLIAESRYASYLSILEDSEEDKYRKGY